MPVTCTDSNLTTITQASPTLAIGMAVYLSGSKIYTPAKGDNFNTSQAVGFVVAAGPNPNQWVIQTEGYNVGAITATDNVSVPISPGTVYYLSTTVAGAITPIQPIGIGLWNKPIYISEQIAGFMTVNAGYILNQRPVNFESIVAYDQAFAMALLFGR
jgi:hypothetical protein